MLESKILWSDKKEVYRISVYVEVLVHLKDLIEKAKLIGSRLNFSDDIKEDPILKIKDISDLIPNFRNAACHTNSYRKFDNEKSFSFIEIRGIGQLNGHPEVRCEYDDDIAFVMGKNVLYLKRHIERAFLELTEIFRNHFGNSLINFALNQG